ncbi:MAG: beta galactosidase jelly roll domain-containing protein, partial [Pseudomonadota bacterium]
DYSDKSWSEIRVPSNWYSEGYDHSGIAWYRHRFDVPQFANDQYYTFVFGAIDYAAHVWVNNTYLGHHTGYFQQFELAVPAGVLKARENTIAIRVDSPLERDEDWSLQKRLIKGIYSHHDTRPGGAWSERGQEGNTGGIWRSVQLRVHSGIEFSAIKSDVELATDLQNASIESAIRISNQLADEREAELVVSLTPHNFAGEPQTLYSRSFRLKPGLNLINNKLQAENIRLWWPYEHGSPRLYRLTFQVTPHEGVTSIHEKVVGFRQVEFDQASSEWTINGKRIFLRGTNYIAAQWLSEIDREGFDRDIQLMRDSHINIVRVHAHVTAKEFYQQADLRGLLIWQDFPLQWGYRDTPDVFREAVRQLHSMLDQFNDHASIVAWSLHNEPPWDASWMKWLYPDYDPEQNRVLDKVLYSIAREADKRRYIHQHSATQEHPWLGWYSGTWSDYAIPTEEPIISEFGAQALPDLDVLTSIVGENNLWPETDEEWAHWKYHNFQPHESFEIARIPRGDNPQELVDNTQQYQSLVVKYAAESYRRQRYEKVGAIFQFMFVENWPSMNWGVVDHKRRKKPGYFALQTAYQPVLPIVEWYPEQLDAGDEVAFPLWVVNDL